MASVGYLLLSGHSFSFALNFNNLAFDVAICRSLHVHPVQTGTTAVCVRGHWAYKCGGRRLVAYRF